MKRWLLVALLLLHAPALAAQDTLAVRDTTVRRLSPVTALWRSFVLPGWGQFSAGAYKRGTFFALAQGSSYYMLVRTNSRLDKAKDHLAARTTTVRDSLIAAGGDTTNLEARLDTMRVLVPARALVDSRERHMQDWITYTIFFTLASGVDAFVAAHLADFPAQVGVDPQTNGSMHVRVSVPLPKRRRR